MDRDAKLMRGGGPTVFTSVKEGKVRLCTYSFAQTLMGDGKGVDDVVGLILAAWRMAGSPGKPGAVQM